MGRIVVHLALLAGVAIVLAGCGFADSHALLPEFMRTRTAELPLPEPPPDVRQLVRKNLDSVFVAASNPQQVRVSPPLHEAYGSGWTACVTAELTSVTGRPPGSETYRITIKDSAIMDRQRDDNCASENYEPI
ncbi:MAG: hypothetical protein WCA28_19525 [Bradyrhizobium sp.]